jgi:hypothetical protein
MQFAYILALFNSSRISFTEQVPWCPDRTTKEQAKQPNIYACSEEVNYLILLLLGSSERKGERAYMHVKMLKSNL